MNKLTRKITAISLCAALCLGGAGAVLAQGSHSSAGNPQDTESPVSAVSPESLPSVQKDETVYVLTDSMGSVQQILVSDWLQNSTASDTIADQSQLEKIENSKGDESFVQGAEQELSWMAQGQDIYYQGEIDKELPICLTVRYQLDGTSISAEDLAGKSGHVTIRFEYENRQTETVEINGQPESVAVPFAVITGFLLDNDHFRNIELRNGKLLNDGDRSVVLGLTFPGLQESLAISEDTLSIPDYVELSADVTDFEFGMTLSIATNEIFQTLDIQKLDSAEGLASSLSDLTEAMNALLDGSSALYDGLTQLQDRSTALVSGTDQLTTGAVSLQEGASSLYTGSTQLRSGLTSLSSGLNQLSSSSSTLNEGAAEIFQGLLTSATQQLQATGLTVPALSAENYTQVLDEILSALDSDSAAAQSICALQNSLDSYRNFYLGLCSYTEHVDAAAAGAAELSIGASTLESGAAQLQDGATTLSDGLQSLQSSLPALIDGIDQLQEGSQALCEGLQQFNEQGIQKLIHLSDGDLASLLPRLKAILQASSQYQNFSGMDEHMTGQVKFIYRTDEIRNS